MVWGTLGVKMQLQREEHNFPSFKKLPALQKVLLSDFIFLHEEKETKVAKKKYSIETRFLF